MHEGALRGALGASLARPHEERAHHTERRDRAADEVGLAVGPHVAHGGLADDRHRLHHLDADDDAELRHHLLERTGDAEVALVHGVGDAGRQRW